MASPSRAGHSPTSLATISRACSRWSRLRVRVRPACPSLSTHTIALVFLDPVAGLPPDAPCWCRSGRRHDQCHGDPIPLSSPGDPVPEGDDDTVFLAPLTSIGADVLRRGFEHAPPVSMPSPEPEQRLLRVPDVAAALAQQPSRSTVPLAELGRMRYQILDDLGLSDPGTVKTRADQLSDEDLANLRYGFFDLAKCTLDRLIEQADARQSPTVIWAGAGAPVRLLGATLMWADHYLVDDEVADELASGAHPDDLAHAIGGLLEIRPLVEVGLIVPVFRDVATTIAAQKAYEQTELDLGRADLVEWVMGQLIMEGPTAKSALLFSVLDDDEESVNFFLHGRFVAFDEENQTTVSRILAPHDPAFDYGPWIAQCRRQTTAGILQEANLELAMAEGFGASWVTLSPFRAKLLEHRSTQQAEAQDLVWADVPHLERASALSLAKVAADDVVVGALRERTREAFAEMRHTPPAERRERAADLAASLKYAAGKLRRDMDREKRWKVAVPTGLSIAAIGIGSAAGGPAGGVIGALVAAAGLAPLRAERLARHEDPAFALVLGDGLVEPRPTTSHPGVPHVLSGVEFPIENRATP
jgi:hypothetical protein